MKNKLTKLASRARRNRRRLDKNRPRLSVFRSERHIYAQIISDKEGITLAAASSLEHKDKRGISAATMVGELIGKRASGVKKLNKTKIVFDRGGFRYHGRVKALAEAARANGLDF